MISCLLDNPISLSSLIAMHSTPSILPLSSTLLSLCDSQRPQLRSNIHLHPQAERKNSTYLKFLDDLSMKAPDFSIPLRPHTVWEGMAVKLSCTVEGCPSPHVTWWGLMARTFTFHNQKRFIKFTWWNFNRCLEYIFFLFSGKTCWLLLRMTSGSLILGNHDYTVFHQNKIYTVQHFSMYSSNPLGHRPSLCFFFIYAASFARYKDGIPLTASSQPWNYKLLQKYGLNTLEIRRWSYF